MKILFFISILSVSIFAQTPEKCACSKKSKSKVRDYFEQIAAQNEFISECNQQYLEKFKDKDNPLPIPKRISGFFPTAISLPKPEYPRIARELKISGKVDVEIISDEEGFVIYAKAISGKKLLHKSAERAACASKFTPVLYCNKPLKQKRIIQYVFVL
jgi:hypothetical protein